MNIVLLQTKLPLTEIEQLLEEFPQFLFLSFSESTYQTLSLDNWGQIEIIYGNKLTSEDLAKAHQLHWIHSPDGELNKLALKDIENKGNILITALREDNFNQIGEFVIGSILSFAKNLYQFREVDRHPPNLWSSKWRDQMMTLQDKVLVQVGLDRTGTEVTRRARQFGMKVWGVQKQKTFHPYCNKCLVFKDIKDALKEGDVVVFNLPRTTEYEGMIGKEELEAIKPGAIVVLLGNSKMVDLEALTELSSRNHFRGLVIDVAYQMPLSQHSPIWKAPNCIITPDVAQRPRTRAAAGISSFRYNLRQYVHGNFKDMRGIISDIGDLIVH